MRVHRGPIGPEIRIGILGLEQEGPPSFPRIVLYDQG